MSLVVYADFGCLDCFLASRCVDALAAAGVEVDWRAVERDPRVPVTGRRLTPDEGVAMKEQLAAVDGSPLDGEDLTLTLPQMVPKTEAAVSGYAEAYGAGVGDDVRRLLFDAYWRHGVDIGSPQVLRSLLAGPILRGHSAAHPLREFGYAVSVNREPITTTAYRRVRTWRNEWMGLGVGTVPTLVEDGGIITGAAVRRRLVEEITRSGTQAHPPELADPARYPAVGVRPDAAWVSQVGRPWTYSLRTPAAR